MIQSYLDILNEHPDNHLDFEIDIPDDLKKIKIPPMLIHAVVEMITHYIHKSSGKKSLISFLGIEKKDGLKFEVTATGLKKFIFHIELFDTFFLNPGSCSFNPFPVI